MDTGITRQKSSLLSTAFVAIFLSVASCQSSPKKEDGVKIESDLPEINIPKGYVLPNPRQLTFIGENFQADFSPIASSMAYLSRNRSKHKHTQIYEMDLIVNKENRVTYHDGVNESVSYTPDGKRILYSSTTDEIKENPRMVQNYFRKLDGKAPLGAASNFLATEIYSSALDGRGIQRITENMGYDGHATLHPQKMQMVFSRPRGNQLDLYTMNLKNKRTWALTKESTNDREARFSPTGRRLAWVKELDKESSVWVGNSRARKAKAITPKGFAAKNPKWHPNGKLLLLSSNHEGNFEIYAADLKSECLTRLTYDHAADTEASFSPDGQKILFTSDRSGRSQIYLMDYRPPKACSKVSL